VLLLPLPQTPAASPALRLPLLPAAAAGARAAQQRHPSPHHLLLLQQRQCQSPLQSLPLRWLRWLGQQVV
jgi:hypothetical protein